MDRCAMKDMYKKGFLNKILKLNNKVIKDKNKRTENDKMLEVIEFAHDEWEDAEMFFQSMIDVDLVDYAIYRLKAATIRYDYLIKLTKKISIKGNYLTTIRYKGNKKNLL